MYASGHRVVDDEVPRFELVVAESQVRVVALSCRGVVNRGGLRRIKRRSINWLPVNWIAVVLEEYFDPAACEGIRRARCVLEPILDGGTITAHPKTRDLSLELEGLHRAGAVWIALRANMSGGVLAAWTAMGCAAEVSFAQDNQELVRTAAAGEILILPSLRAAGSGSERQQNQKGECRDNSNDAKTPLVSPSNHR
jgi:hypothetical protein